MKLPSRLGFSLLLLTSALASATTLVALDVSGLTTTSDLILRGRVTEVSARVTGDGARIMTDARIDVLEVLKGTPGLAQVTAMQPGGVVGERGQVVHGTARFQVGEEVVVFLESRGSRATVAGMFQGRFVVDRSGATAMARQQADGQADLVDAVTHQPVERAPLALSLDTLRAQIRAALPSQAPASTTPGPVKVSP